VNGADLPSRRRDDGAALSPLMRAAIAADGDAAILGIGL